MSEQSLDELFDAFITHAEERNVDDAEATLQQIEDRFGELRQEEHVNVRQSSASRRSVSDGDVQDLIDHLDTSTQLEFSRSGFLVQARTLLEDIQGGVGSAGTTSDQRVSNRIDDLSRLATRLAECQSEYEAVEAEALGLGDGEESGARIAINGINAPAEVSTGETFDVSVAVENTGDETATGVSATISLYRGNELVDQGGFDVDDGELEPGEQASVAWENVSDVETIFATVDSDNAGSDGAERSVSYSGGGDDGTDHSIEEYVDADGVVDTPGLMDAIEDWRDDDLDTSLLLDVIQAWRSGEPLF